MLFIPLLEQMIDSKNKLTQSEQRIGTLNHLINASRDSLTYDYRNKHQPGFSFKSKNSRSRPLLADSDQSSLNEIPDSIKTHSVEPGRNGVKVPRLPIRVEESSLDDKGETFYVTSQDYNNLAQNIDPSTKSKPRKRKLGLPPISRTSKITGPQRKQVLVAPFSIHGSIDKLRKKKKENQLSYLKNSMSTKKLIHSEIVKQTGPLKSYGTIAKSKLHRIQRLQLPDPKNNPVGMLEDTSKQYSKFMKFKNRFERIVNVGVSSPQDIFMKRLPRMGLGGLINEDSSVNF